MNKGYVQDWLPDESDGSFPTQPAPKRTAPNNPRIRIAAHKCHVIVVYSLSGGTGKTTIATNVAAALQSEGERVLLMDCALQSGDVGVFLNLFTQFTLYDLLLNPDYLLSGIENSQPELLDDPIILHNTGIQVLLAPHNLNQVKKIDINSLIQLITRLCDSFDFIVIDTASQLD